MNKFIIKFVEFGEIKTAIIEDCYTSLHAVMKFKDKYGDLEILSCQKDSLSHLFGDIFGGIF